jgi:hypothetical protein
MMAATIFKAWISERAFHFKPHVARLAVLIDAEPTGPLNLF